MRASKGEGLMDLSPVRALESAIAAVDRDELPQVIGELARLEALARLRLSENGRSLERPAPDIRPLGKLIDANAAARLLGTNVRWLYDRADELPFTRRLGPRTLRFDEAALRRWLDTRR